MIGTAKECCGVVYVYDEHGSSLCSLMGHLVGFTGSTVSIRYDGSDIIYVYDEHGSSLYSV